jgi:16S rRNA (cytosine967-C5)-methyltransferase
VSGPRRRPDARAVAVEALVRIDQGGAYANLVTPSLLDGSGLDARDRRFVTGLVYGTVRMQRACDWLAERFLAREVEPAVRAALRVGAYQLAFLGTPPHAAVDATVSVAPKRARGLVNAVLRRVADAPRDWPNDGIRLSYPDWIVDRLRADLGAEVGTAALEAMNEPGGVDERDDGYVQDRASQWVADHVGAQPGERVLDLCAAPGGKATRLAATGAWVVASDLNPVRLGLVRANRDRLGLELTLVAADGRRLPHRAGTFDRVLLDAPCSGLGALRRRADARWRITPDAVDRLARVQRELVDEAAAVVAPGGRLVYSVCTLTTAESSEVARHIDAHHDDLVRADPPAPPWEPWEGGGRLLPQAEGTDGMAVFDWHRRT